MVNNYNKKFRNKNYSKTDYSEKTPSFGTAPDLVEGIKKQIISSLDNKNNIFEQFLNNQKLSRISDSLIYKDIEDITNFNKILKEYLEQIKINDINLGEIQVPKSFIDTFVKSILDKKIDGDGNEDRSIEYLINSSNKNIYKDEIKPDLQNIALLEKSGKDNEIYDFMIQKFYSDESNISMNDMDLLGLFIFVPDKYRHIYQSFFAFKIFEDYVNSLTKEGKFKIKDKDENDIEKEYKIENIDEVKTLFIDYIRLYFITKHDLVSDLENLDKQDLDKIVKSKLEFKNKSEKVKELGTEIVSAFYSLIGEFGENFNSSSVKSGLSKYAWFYTDTGHGTNKITGNISGTELYILLDEIEENKEQIKREDKLFILEDDENQAENWKNLYKTIGFQEKNIIYVNNYIEISKAKNEENIGIYFFDIQNYTDNEAGIEGANSIIIEKLENISEDTNTINILICSDNDSLVKKAKIFFENLYENNNQIDFRWEDYYERINKIYSGDPKIILEIKSKSDFIKGFYI